MVGAGLTATGWRGVLSVRCEQRRGWKPTSTRGVAEAGGVVALAGGIARQASGARLGVAAMPSSCAEEAGRSVATESQPGATSVPARSTIRSAAASRPHALCTKPWDRIPSAESTPGRTPAAAATSRRLRGDLGVLVEPEEERGLRADLGPLHQLRRLGVAQRREVARDLDVLLELRDRVAAHDDRADRP
jgi:hypothetical protein